eukprot:TRINITY_DN1944_c0_g1_i1.p1 TRINITY_DN1944_c0_g1~~TRINITY_DN1944_c0_g1_i1.p1  ORF type:complete len:224 (-),score=9.81 TRINITY_DN1944_c0_g1_i1:446-1117(-)
MAVAAAGGPILPANEYENAIAQAAFKFNGDYPPPPAQLEITSARDLMELTTSGRLGVYDVWMRARIVETIGTNRVQALCDNARRAFDRRDCFLLHLAALIIMIIMVACGLGFIMTAITTGVVTDNEGSNPPPASGENTDLQPAATDSGLLAVYAYAKGLMLAAHSWHTSDISGAQHIPCAWPDDGSFPRCRCIAGLSSASTYRGGVGPAVDIRPVPVAMVPLP